MGRRAPQVGEGEALPSPVHDLPVENAMEASIGEDVEEIAYIDNERPREWGHQESYVISLTLHSQKLESSSHIH